MKKNVFKKIISEWLESESRDLLEREVKLKPSKNIISALIGPRRVGKTSVMLLEAQKHNKDEVIFIDFEDNRLAGLKGEELDDIFVAHYELTGKEPKYLFFDEIQEAPQWSKFVRRLHNSKKYCIVVTGSSSKLLSREIATELRGRYVSKLLLPLSFREFLDFRGFEFKKTMEFTNKRGKVLKLLGEYIDFGGFPELINMKTYEKKELVKSYFETIFYKDIVERHNIENTDLMEQLINHLLENNSCRFSINNFYKVMENRGVALSKKTISLYLKYLEEAFFIFFLEKFSYSSKVRSQNPKKAYLIDNVFETFLSPNFSPDKGKKLESIIMNELAKKYDKVYYFTNSKECDFVINSQKEKRALQVCFEINEKNENREVEGLIEAMKKLNLDEGELITFEEEKEINKDGKKIFVIPAWKWLLYKI